MANTFIADDLFVSAGGVLVDEQTKRFLIIKKVTSNEYLLPKGTKEDNETIEETAVREVYEETGYKNELTLPPKLLAIQVRPQVGGTTGQHKVVFWFYNKLVSNDFVANTQMDNENYVSEWHCYESAIKVLSFENDKRLIGRAFEVLSDTTLNIPTNKCVSNVIEEAIASNSIRVMLLDREMEVEQRVIVVDRQRQYVMLNREDQTRIHCLVPTYDDHNKNKPFAIELSASDHGDKYLVRQWFTDETFNADQKMRPFFNSLDQNRIWCPIVEVIPNLNDHDARLLTSLNKH